MSQSAELCPKLPHKTTKSPQSSFALHYASSDCEQTTCAIIREGVALSDQHPSYLMHAVVLLAATPHTGFHLALFTSKKICKIGIVALSFVFDKYCPIMD